ncbi:uncharacterized protein isoform X1 [Rhodnius prolixus]|uniref:Tetratricopeptide repeat protein 29 n=1 Tax=Rhodnius prolixus TaxID=13249 RepID=A0ABL0EHQ3_RHOPR
MRLVDPKERLAYLKELLNEESTERINYPTFHEIPTQRAVECGDDISLINVKSKTFLFDTMKKLRLFDGPKELTSIKKIKAFHGEIIERLKTLFESVNFYETNTYDPPKIKMVRRILEQGYLDAAKRVIHLINIEISVRTTQGEYYKENTGDTCLEKNFDLILIFLLLFKKADKLKKLQKVEEVTSIYLYLAIYYERENNKWLWLAYELYTFAMDTCKCYNKDQGLTEATVRYMLGRLCFFRMNKLDEAIQHFQIVCGLSEGRSWSASAFSGIKDDYIYPTARYILYISHVAMVSEKKVENPKEVLHHLQEALITSATRKEYLELLIPLADAYNNENNPKDAKKYLKQYVSMLRSNQEGLSEEMSLSNPELAKQVTLRFFYYNLCEDKYYGAIEYLYHFYKLAKMQKDMRSEAFAYKYYGLLFLQKDFFSYAYCLLTHATRMFILLNDEKNELILKSILCYFQNGVITMNFSELDDIDGKLLSLFIQNVKNEIPENLTINNLFECDVEKMKHHRKSSIDSVSKFEKFDSENFMKPLRNANKHKRIVFDVYFVERPKIKKLIKEQKRKKESN